MEVDAFLADAVQAIGGKLSALGVGWRVLSVGGLPARHDRIGLGVMVHLLGAETGGHRLDLALLDPDGTARTLGNAPDGSDIRTLQAPFDVPGSGERTATFALNLDGLVFERAGGYTFVVSVDGEERARLPFAVAMGGAGQPPGDQTGTGTGIAAPGYL